jgi:hypothetical protein
MPLNNDCFLTEGLELTGCTKNNIGGVDTVYFANSLEARIL